MLWDKQSDSFITENSDFSKRLTRRNILQILPSINDPLGSISLCLLTGKVIYRNFCEINFMG